MSTIYTFIYLHWLRYLLVFLFASVAVPSTAQYKIMVLGNSITQGNTEHPGYRYRLWQKLLNAGVDVELVGSHDVNNGGDPAVKGTTYKGYTYSNRNEGHWGWRADEILHGSTRDRTQGRLKEWLQGYTPDVALLHIGSNDVMQEQSVESTIKEVEEIIKEIRKKNPLVTILLAQLIPIWYDKVGGATVDRLNSFNAQIPLLAERLNTPESPVIVVDQFTGFDPTPNADTWDGIHPNSSGEEKMAQKWYNALDPVITPLPVELVSFSARSNTEGYVELSWQTTSETDNAYFEVQRSANGKTFAPIGRVEGAGTTSVLQSYTYTDSSAMREVYYRLLQVDTDSTHNYSKVVQVRVPDRAVGLQVFPTSSSGQHLTLHLQHNSTVPEADVLIYTSEGRLVHQMHNVASDRGSVRTKIPTHELHGAGLYLVRVVTTDRVYHTEFVVER